eukprot:TRINITY_DN4485_c0_g2_i3.p1 TRINITY_DN4485_c0_g2~~TRINITY_DN4485_c0_g2_i3.p1  ORF type:complete len:651 (-),score=105.70 TRINITY_DN4485_c0_g2_i3:31-1983(-)
MCYKTTPTDQRLVLNRWSEVKSRVSDIAVSFLNLYDDVPAKYTEGLQDTIKEIPELAHECDMLNVVAHDVVHEACYDEWISGDNILQMLSKCGGSGTITISPVCGFLSQFLCYMLFLIVLTLPIFIRSANRDDIFWMGEYINGQLLGPFEEGGEGIANGEAFYQYLEFLTAELFNPANRNSTKLKLYDDIVLRQYAVKVEKCRDDSPYNCTKDLSIFDQDRNNDSPKKLGEFTSDGRSVYYTKMNGLLFDGDLRYTISKDNTNTSASIQDLRNDNWISDGTRVVIAEIGLINDNNRVVSFVSIIVEFSSFGSTSSQIEKFFVDISPPNPVTTIRFVLLLLFCVSYIVLEYQEMLRSAGGSEYQFKKSCVNYWSDLWNVLDLVVYFAIIILVVMKEYITQDLQQSTDIINTGFFLYWVDVIISFVTLLAWFKAVFYLTIFSKLGPLIDAIWRMTTDILVFIILGACLLLGFAPVFQFLLGSSTEGFLTLTDSMFTLLSFGLGNYQFQSESTGVNVTLSNILLIAYLLFILILLVNLLIAMMGTTYESTIDIGVTMYRQRFVSLYLQYKTAYWVPPLNIIKAVIDTINLCNNKHAFHTTSAGKVSPHDKKKAVAKLVQIYTTKNSDKLDGLFKDTETDVQWILIHKNTQLYR